jgi:uncharacterized membrane protein
MDIQSTVKSGILSKRLLLTIYAKTFFIFLLCDAVWLTEISPAFYRRYIGHLLAERPDLWAALVFYLIFIAGVTWFAVLPSALHYRFRNAFARGAFFGLVTYATFDLTCQAVLKDWPVLVTIVDLVWGSTLTGVTTALAARKAL